MIFLNNSPLEFVSLVYLSIYLFLNINHTPALTTITTITTHNIQDNKIIYNKRTTYSRQQKKSDTSSIAPAPRDGSHANAALVNLGS